MLRSSSSCIEDSTGPCPSCVLCTVTVQSTAGARRKTRVATGPCSMPSKRWSRSRSWAQLLLVVGGATSLIATTGCNGNKQASYCTYCTVGSLSWKDDGRVLRVRHYADEGAVSFLTHKSTSIVAIRHPESGLGKLTAAREDRPEYLHCTSKQLTRSSLPTRTSRQSLTLQPHLK